MNPTNLIRQRWALGALALLMALTRFHHEGTPFALPDASLAVFFLAGFYANRPRHFVALLVLALAVDYLAIAGFGVDDYCLSPAYAFLIPTYGVMWWAGVWLSGQSSQPWLSYIAKLAGALGASTSVAFLVSNASFFWFSGKLASVGFFEYAQGLSSEYLPYVGAAAVYAMLGLGLGAMLSAVAAGARLGGMETR